MWISAPRLTAFRISGFFIRLSIFVPPTNTVFLKPKALAALVTIIPCGESMLVDVYTCPPHSSAIFFWFSPIRLIACLTLPPDRGMSSNGTYRSSLLNRMF